MSWETTPTGPALVIWAIAQAGTLFVLWLRARNDSRNARVSQIETLSAALNSALGSLDVMRRRQDDTERARAAERETASLARIEQQNAIDALKDEQARLCKLVEVQAQEIARLQAENIELKARIGTLEQERNALRSERDALRRERDSLSRESDDLRRSTSALKVRVEELEREVESLKKGTGAPPATESDAGEAQKENAESEETGS